MRTLSQSLKAQLNVKLTVVYDVLEACLCQCV